MSGLVPCRPAPSWRSPFASSYWTAAPNKCRHAPGGIWRTKCPQKLEVVGRRGLFPEWKGTSSNGSCGIKRISCPSYCFRATLLRLKGVFTGLHSILHGCCSFDATANASYPGLPCKRRNIKHTPLTTTLIKKGPVPQNCNIFGINTNTAPPANTEPGSAGFGDCTPKLSHFPNVRHPSSRLVPTKWGIPRRP